MKVDISSRADIEKMVLQFYEAVKADKTIGFIFTDVVHMNWEKHIPVIVDFWETIFTSVKLKSLLVMQMKGFRMMKAGNYLYREKAVLVFYF